MGLGQIGGNGSVEWAIDVNQANWHISIPKAPGGVRQGGVDPSAQAGQNFTVSVEPLQGQSPNDLLAALKAGMHLENGRVEFTHRIEERNPDQIQIRW
jgi:hypothetical protein